MIWFKERQKRMSFLQNYIPTSKAQLLQVAMWYHKGDTEKAQAMVDFYAKNMPNLPDFDPVQPSFMDDTKATLSSLYSWIKENQGDIIQGYQFIYSLIKNRGAMTIAAPEAPLPPINE